MFKFIKATPVWENGKSTSINYTLDFVSHLKNQPGSKLFVAGSSSFIIYVNGNLLTLVLQELHTVFIRFLKSHLTNFSKVKITYLIFV